MADDNRSFGLDMPAGAPTNIPKEVTEIHVIPEEFYGAAAKHRPLPPKTETPTGALPLSAQPQGQKSEQADGKKSKAGLMVLILVIILLIAAGIAGYFLIYKKGGATCGDGTCSSPENYQTCPNDCEPPSAVCGDNKCEKPENHISCPNDCEPPPPECGDGACDAEESYETCPRDCEPPPPECGDGKCEMNRGETYGECPADCEPPPPEQASDRDSDGLTDAEETEIFGSDPNSVNTDGDSFVDLNEVLNLFNPAAPDPSRLVDNPGITIYRNEDFGIELLRPVSWGVRDIPVERTVRFTAPTGEIIKVSLYSKTAGVSLVDWLENAPIEGIASINNFESLINRRGYEQIITSDRRATLVSNNEVVVMLTYDLANELQIRYRVTLSMIANSLEFIGTPKFVAGEGTDSTSLPISEEAPPEEDGTLSNEEG